MGGAVRAGYLSPPLPPPPLMVIYPLWAFALSEAATRGWVGPRQMMTGGSVRSTNRLPLSSICVDAFHFTAWQNSVYNYLTATRRCLITGAEEERTREDEREKQDDSG